MSSPTPAYSPFAHLWTLDPEITYLNHGAYGACTRAVRAAQDAWRERAQTHPVEFYGFQRPAQLEAARASLAAFLGAQADELAFVPRASTAANALLRSLSFGEGDELLTTDHAFHATRDAISAAASRAGAAVVVAPVPFPLRSPDEVTAAIFARVTPRTRLIVVDHVVSQTALVFPIAEIVKEADRRGVEVLIDGAHATGQVPVNLTQLGAAYYVGNTHKWLGSPPSAGFIHVRADRRERVVSDPRTSLAQAFAWLMPHDPTPFLGIPTAIDHLGQVLPGGWAEIMRRNHDLAVAARDELCRTFQIEVPCPASMVGCMAAVPLPPARDGVTGWPDPLQVRLLEKHRISAPIFAAPGSAGRVVRLSAQLYNTPAQYTALANALVDLLREERRA